jgi:hypothetical protein
MDNNSDFNSTDGNVKLSADDSQSQVNTVNFLLPRSAWSSQVAYLRVLFRAKKALDRIEQQAEYSVFQVNEVHE